MIYSSTKNWIFTALLALWGVTGSAQSIGLQLKAPSDEIEQAEAVLLATRKDTMDLKALKNAFDSLDAVYLRYFKQEYKKNGLPDLETVWQGYQLYETAKSTLANPLSLLKKMVESPNYSEIFKKRLEKYTGVWVRLIAGVSSNQSTGLVLIKYAEHLYAMQHRLNTDVKTVLSYGMLLDNYLSLMENHAKSCELYENLSNLDYTEGFFQQNILYAMATRYEKLKHWNKAETIYRKILATLPTTAPNSKRKDKTQENPIGVSFFIHRQLSHTIRQQGCILEANAMDKMVADSLKQLLQTTKSSKSSAKKTELEELFQKLLEGEPLTMEELRQLKVIAKPEKIAKLSDRKAKLVKMVDKYRRSKDYSQLFKYILKTGDAPREVRQLAHELHLIGEVGVAQSVLEDLLVDVQNAEGYYTDSYSVALAAYVEIAIENGQYPQTLDYEKQIFHFKQQFTPPFHPDYAHEQMLKLADAFQQNDLPDSARYWRQQATLQLEQSKRCKDSISDPKRLPTGAFDALWGQNQPLNALPKDSLAKIMEAFKYRAAWESVFQNEKDANAEINHNWKVEFLLAAGELQEAAKYQQKSQNIPQPLDALKNERLGIQIAEQTESNAQTVVRVQKWWASMQQFIEERFDFLTTYEKTQFMETLDKEFAIVMSVLSRKATTGAEFYNIAVLQKAISLTSIQSFQRKLWDLSAISPEVQARGEKFEDLSRQASQENLSLQVRANIHRKLDKVRGELRTIFKSDWAKATWREVQKQLKDAEVAIEIIDFQYSTPTGVTDSTVYYAAVLRKEYAQPMLLRLFDAKQLTQILSLPPHNNPDQYKNYFNELYITQSTKLYNLIWQPFEKAGFLHPHDTIYLSVSGLLNQVALGTLLNEEDSLLSHRYHLNLLNTTREILFQKQSKILNINDLPVLLVGGANYEADSLRVMQAFEFQKMQLPNATQLSLRSLTPRQQANWSYLPESLKEVQMIKAFFPKATLLTDFAASEDVVREQLKTLPQIIHIATHGAYTSPPRRKLTPIQSLHNNFLLLAGCQRTMTQGKPSWLGLEDGALTAAEVADMNLKTTQLVVLSACETGLGDLRGREGVFGLARGFKLAGAQYQLVSLWKVNDKSTSQFMQAFYQAYVKGVPIEKAFTQAQNELQKLYPNSPYDWGAWVLIR